MTLAEGEKYRFFSHRECEYFPCHSGVDTGEFNCLFCYCPLYALGKGCGGNFKITENGRKDCSDCTIPHRRENYERIVGRYNELAELVRLRL
ncbi:MAG: metal-binding protein [Lachnospiraceae bacterium]|jgi:Zn-finger protein|nr:metal-binding protein [Lachnospiraceae bacterium]